MLTAAIPIAFVVHPSLKVGSLGDLVALARSRPGQLSYGSSGTGGPHHFAMELFKSAAGIDLVHVPYKGGAPQLNDLLGGHIPIGSIGLPPAIEHIKAGKLRPLALTDSERSTLMPDLPTVGELGFPGFAVSYWMGLLAPAGTPRAIINRLHAETSAILAMPNTKGAFEKSGAEIRTSSPDDFRTLIDSEIRKWSDVAQRSGITAE
jgi:tripartite-type tricarboxylate transporter receptor subunit TctC